MLEYLVVNRLLKVQVNYISYTLDNGRLSWSREIPYDNGFIRRTLKQSATLQLDSPITLFGRCYQGLYVLTTTKQLYQVVVSTCDWINGTTVKLQRRWYPWVLTSDGTAVKVNDPPLGVAETA